MGWVVEVEVEEGSIQGQGSRVRVSILRPKPTRVSLAREVGSPKTRDPQQDEKIA